MRLSLSYANSGNFAKALIALWCVAAFAAPQEFNANYALYRNGKLMGSSDISLAKNQSGYIFSTSSQSEGGWASLIGGAKISEVSLFKLAGGQFQSSNYDFRQAVSLKKKTRTVSFDWVKNWAEENDGKNRMGYALRPGTLDRNLVVLALAEDLKTPGAALQHPVAYKGEVTLWKFANSGVEKVSTAMGVIEADKLERVRENSERRTISWHAAKFGYLPIKIAQIEPNGDSIEMRLKSVRLAQAK
jgi:hypothetical protein